MDPATMAIVYREINRLHDYELLDQGEKILLNTLKICLQDLEAAAIMKMAEDYKK